MASVVEGIAAAVVVVGGEGKRAEREVVAAVVDCGGWVEDGAGSWWRGRRVWVVVVVVVVVAVVGSGEEWVRCGSGEGSCWACDGGSRGSGIWSGGLSVSSGRMSGALVESRLSLGVAMMLASRSSPSDLSSPSSPWPLFPAAANSARSLSRSDNWSSTSLFRTRSAWTSCRRAWILTARASCSSRVRSDRA